jgi:hypothetical protein
MEGHVIALQRWLTLLWATDVWAIFQGCRGLREIWITFAHLTQIEQAGVVVAVVVVIANVRDALNLLRDESASRRKKLRRMLAATVAVAYRTVINAAMSTVKVCVMSEKYLLALRRRKIRS